MPLNLDKIRRGPAAKFLGDQVELLSDGGQFNAYGVPIGDSAAASVLRTLPGRVSQQSLQASPWSGRFVVAEEYKITLPYFDPDEESDVPLSLENVAFCRLLNSDKLLRRIDDNLGTSDRVDTQIVCRVVGEPEGE